MLNNRTFFQTIVPSILAFALSGVYTVVDGFFIGNSLGDAGLAAINIAFPLTALLQALGTGIGLAGAIRYTILGAQRKDGEQREMLGGTVLLLLAVSLLMTGLFAALAQPLLRLLGAQGDILTLAGDYLFVIALGAAFQIFATGLVPFIRNMGGAVFAMAAMIAGFVTNIILDYLFIWTLGWGMAGAALATVAGQAATMLATALFLLVKKARFAPPPLARLPALWKPVLRVSFSPFGLTFSPNITLILMNRFLLLYGDARAVAAYACIAYITAIVYLLLQGVGDGSQPLVSRFYGERAGNALRRTRALAYRTGAAIGLACMLGLFLARNRIGLLFGASPAVNRDVAAMLPLFLSSVLLLAFVRITTAYFYATDQGGLSYVLVYAEPVLLLALLLTLPLRLGATGVWIAVPLAQALTWLIACRAKRRADRRMAAA